MTALLDRDELSESGAPDNDPLQDEPVSAVRVAAAAALAGAAGGWVLAGVFDAAIARFIGLLAPAIGAAVAALAATRWRRNPLGPWLAVPAAVVTAWLVVLPEGAGVSLPRLVMESLRAGGISQPPLPFDPGWRIILAFIAVLLGSASTGLALSTANARIAPLLGAGVVLVGVLVQPTGGAVVSVAGALVLCAASLAVAVGGESGEGSGGFEARRLGRGAGALVGMVAVIVSLSQLGFLFPDSTDEQVIPPKRPEVPPSVPDRVLFKVDASRPVPLRLGVLDVYDGRGFLTPPYDTSRFEDAPTERAADGDVSVTVTVADLGGHLLPAPASPKGVRGVNAEIDPRTQQLRLPKSRVRKGLRYTVAAPPVPSTEKLDAAEDAPDRFDEFTDVPPPPKIVSDLLAAAPDTPYSRVQFMRTALYTRVIAAGAGNPVDVPPVRVAEFLEGGEATPFEITASEALLARWAGVPARLGYGYYDPQGAAEIRPRNGATWLEAYFEGSGWVPIVGSPPRAQSSFNSKPKKQDPLVRPTDELALVVFVPVRRTTVQQLYSLVRYWLLRVVPVAAALALLWAVLPGVARSLRRARRSRWATGRGAPGRLLVAYAELRDAAIDMNVGRPDMTALEFTNAVAPDEEHTQLAWLMTRGLWGDLSRDLSDDDVKGGEDMAASITRRLRRAQPVPNRLGAMVSRASLRAPWSTEMPNVRVPRRVLAGAVAVAVVVVLVSVLVLRPEPTVTTTAGGLPDVLAPARIGDVELRPEPTVEQAFAEAGSQSIIEAGRVFSLRQGDEIEGSLQIAALENVSAADAKVRRAVVKSIGQGRFRLTRIGQVRAYVLDAPEQRFLLWFPPDGRSYNLLVTRATFDQADRVFAAVIAHQRGVEDTGLGVPVPDPRRGVPE